MVDWRIGSCTNGNKYEISDKDNPFVMNVFRCCLPPGEYILICKAPNRNTWLTGYIMIDGRKYCNDFIGFQGFYRLQITGKNIVSIFHFWLSYAIYLDQNNLSVKLFNFLTPKANHPQHDNSTVESNSIASGKL